MYIVLQMSRCMTYMHAHSVYECRVQVSEDLTHDSILSGQYIGHNTHAFTGLGLFTKLECH